MPETLTTAPVVEPLDREEAKLHLRVDVADDDYLIDGLIAAARSALEVRVHRAFITQTYTLTLPRFPGARIQLPWAPLQSVTSINYLDGNGDSQLLASTVYNVIAPAGPFALPGWIELAWAQAWPSTRSQDEAVTIVFVAGYGDGAADVPTGIKQAMLLQVGNLYEHREEIIAQPGMTVAILPSSEYLLAPYRIMRP